MWPATCAPATDSRRPVPNSGLRARRKTIDSPEPEAAAKEVAAIPR